MSKPVILTVDDELQVRNAVERDLRIKYGQDYRIIKTALHIYDNLKGSWCATIASSRIASYHNIQLYLVSKQKENKDETSNTG